jgi:transposase
MDSGLLIKELAKIFGVTEDSVINWEKRGRMPHKKTVRAKVKQFVTERG